MTKLAPEWVRTSDPGIKRPARYRWTTAPAYLKHQRRGSKYGATPAPAPRPVVFVFQICKKLMALPLLPQQHVAQVFQAIKANMDDHVPTIAEVVNYMCAPRG